MQCVILRIFSPSGKSVDLKRSHPFSTQYGSVSRRNMSMRIRKGSVSRGLQIVHQGPLWESNPRPLFTLMIDLQIRIFLQNHPARIILKIPTQPFFQKVLICRSQFSGATSLSLDGCTILRTFLGECAPRLALPHSHTGSHCYSTNEHARRDVGEIDVDKENSRLTYSIEMIVASG